MEVLVSIAILGLGLTAILSAQAGSFAAAAQARSVSLATGLARCKMSELEEQVLRDGFQETDQTGEGPCCDADESSGMRCTWRIEKLQLPDPKYGDLNLGSSLNLGGSASSSAGGAPGALGLLAGGLGAGATGLGNISNPAEAAGAIAGIAAGASDPNAPSSGAGMGVDAIGQMAMSFVYPTLKGIFEASTRRLTVVITWRSGAKNYSFDLVQWFALPQKGLSVENPEDPNASSSSSSGGSSSGGSSGNPPKR